MNEDLLFERMAASPLDGHGGHYQVVFQALGTQNRILFGAGAKARADAFRVEALRWLAHFEATYSVFIEESLISRINREAQHDWVPIDAATEQLFALCDWLNWKT